MSTNTASHTRLTLVGCGTIGLSFAALHLTKSQDVEVTIFDTRPDLESYLHRTLPGYLSAISNPIPLSTLLRSSRLRLSPDLSVAVSKADIVQEQGPENSSFKQSIWKSIEDHAPHHALFWSSTSGIPASTQGIHMKNPGRLMVVHPFNPPHIMPLLEVVPGPATPEDLVERTLDYWRARDRSPVVIRREVPGFVANRLAYALLREAVHLVQEGVISVSDLDAVVENSMGPRWAVAGPFKSYHMGGGEGGLRGFFGNIGGTVGECWEDQGQVHVGGDWEEKVFGETERVYGESKGLSTNVRDERTKEVLKARRDGVQPEQK